MECEGIDMRLSEIIGSLFFGMLIFVGGAAILQHSGILQIVGSIICLIGLSGFDVFIIRAIISSIGLSDFDTSPQQDDAGNTTSPAGDARQSKRQSLMNPRETSKCFTYHTTIHRSSASGPYQAHF